MARIRDGILVRPVPVEGSDVVPVNVIYRTDQYNEKETLDGSQSSWSVYFICDNMLRCVPVSDFDIRPSNSKST